MTALPPNGRLAAAVTPVDVVERLHAAVNKALASGTAAEAFDRGELTSMAGTPAQFAALLQAETGKYARITPPANFSIEG